MWLMVMFDLPTKTARERSVYSDFRKFLLVDGFMMLQYSIYTRYCASEENAEVHTNRVCSCLPPEGEVRVLKITDKQFGRMQVFHGKKPKQTEKAPEQVTLL